MRNLFYCILSSVLLVALSGCHGGQKEANTNDNVADEDVPHIEISDDDRRTVNDSLSVFLNLMRAHQYEQAVNMLWVWDGEFVSRLSGDAAQKQLMIYKQLPGVDYKLESVMFKTETDNIAKYRVVLFEKEEGDNSPNTITFGLNPIRREGRWFLTVSDAFAETH